MNMKSLRLEKALRAALFVLLLGVVGMMKVYAYDFSAVCSTGQTLYYNITDATNHYVELTYPGTVNYNGWEGYNEPSGNIVLPTTVRFSGIKYRVTAVGDYAFYGCSNLSGSLIIPNTVTMIGCNSFTNCSSLTGDLTIPENMNIILGHAFKNCGFTSIHFNAVNCESVSYDYYASTWYAAFENNTSLQHIVIGNNVTHIPAHAFEYTYAQNCLLTIGNSLQTIGNNAFYNNGDSTTTGLSGNLVFPATLMSIGDNAFSYNYNLSGDLDFPSSLTTIGDNVFNDCVGLSGILTIPENVTRIGMRSFVNCRFSEIHFNAINCVSMGLDENYQYIYYVFWLNSNLQEIVIGENVTQIPDFAFGAQNSQNCHLTFLGNSVTRIGYNAFIHDDPNDVGLVGELVIPSSVTEIGANAFYGCSGLTGSLTIPNSVTTIGVNAFYGCSGLNGSLTIGNSVTSIGSNVFYGCSGLTGSLTIPNSVTTIGVSAFDGCSGFTGALTIPNSVTSIGDWAFYDCSSFTGSLTIGNFVTSIGNGAFYGCSGFTGSLTIGNSVTSIGASAFYGCSGFTGSLTIPNSVESIGTWAFYGCSGFTGSLTIPNSVTSIENYTFKNCSGFTGFLTIPSSVTSIDQQAFCGCSGFSGLTVPNSVTYINDHAFYGCSGLASVTMLANNPPVLGNYVFNNVDNTIPVYVPCASILTYQNTTGWNEFSYYLPGTACDSGEVTVTLNPTVGGTVTGTGFYEGGAICTVTATANDGYTFLYWKEGDNIVSWDTAYSFFVSGDRDLVAVFTQGEVCNVVFDLNDTYGDGWTGNYLVVDYGNSSYEQLFSGSGLIVSYSRPVETGSLVTLTWISGSYTEECSFDISFENGVPIYHGENLSSNFQYEFVLDCDAAYASYSISGVAVPEEGGTVEGAGTYDAGETCTLTAIPNSGYRFAHWTENGTHVSTEASYSFIVNRERNLVAVFVETFQPFLELQVVAEHYPDSLDSNSPYVNVHWGCTLPNCEIVESFETGDFSIFDWQTDPTYPWTITTNNPYEGNYCMKSGGAGVANVTSNMTVMVYVPADGVMSFFGKISCENQWDFGYFYIDGVQMGTYTGDGQWAERTFDITTGDHTFQWRYTKDDIVDSNDDCFYVDNITFYKQSHPSIQGETYTFDDSSMHGWTSIDADGDGYGWMLASDVMGTGYGYNGSNDCMISMSYNNSVGVLYPDNYLVSPLTQLGGVLKFYACAQDANYSAEHFGVAVSTTNANPSSFTMLNEWTITAKSAGEPNGKPVKGNRSSRAQGNWYEYTVDLSAYSGSGYVAIRHFNCSDMFYLNIDNIAIGEPIDPNSFDKYSVYRANCDGSEIQLISDNVTENQYIDTEWLEMVQGQYKYGVSIGDSPNADIFWSNCIEKQGNVAVQTTALAKGWNWYSTYIEQEDINGLGQLENSIGVPDAIIQSQYDGYVKSGLRNGIVIWKGALSSINNEEMYKIGTKRVRSATMEGQIADPANHPITIYKGWNWIGFPCSQSVSVNEALSGFSPKNNDIIKGIHSYATYSDGTWNGTLNTLEPGQGYMYGSKDRRPKTLVFQTGRGEATNPNNTPENNFFQPSEDYADNMTLTAIIELDGEELRSEDYELAAFVGDECRGSVKLMYVEPIDRYVAFLTVFGDQEEDMRFVLTNGENMNWSDDQLTFAVDGISGTLTEPATLHFGTSVQQDYVNIFPNPSNGVFNIEGKGIRKVSVIDAFGQIILSKEVGDDLMQIDLNGKAAGIYMLQIVTDNGITTRQLIKK